MFNCQHYDSPLSIWLSVISIITIKVIIIIRSHRPYYVRRCSLLLPTEQCGLSVGPSVCHASEPCKNGWTDRDAAWVEDSGGPMEPCIRLESRSPHWKGQLCGRKGQPTVKYRTLCSHLSKNSWTDSDTIWIVGSDWPKESWIRWGSRSPIIRVNFGQRVNNCKV